MLSANRGDILYVEDNAENRLLMKRILGAEGYTVHEASSAKQALKILETLIPSAILMDINMPDMDGYTLTTSIRSLAHLKFVPIIALTANVMRGDRERSIKAGCDGYIQKPIDIDTIVTQIERFFTR